MPVRAIPFKQTHYFSNLICDYLDQKPVLKPFYHRFPKLENFKPQLKEKQDSYPTAYREILYTAIERQYENFKITDTVHHHIKLFQKKTTFTITTGHQLNLFTGPLYFLYKIISTINLTETLKDAYPEFDFIPIYWMATEDHDFDEINYFNFRGKKIQWNREGGGMVGAFDTDGLDRVLELFSGELGVGDHADYLRSLFKEAYLDHKNLADATRYIANELFGTYGLVCVDGDDKELKKLFIPYIEKELLTQKSTSAVQTKADQLKEMGYKAQVNPRAINLFYLQKGLRERIIEKEGRYFVNNTQIVWSRNEILEHLEKNPEKFSPNVMTRPLYQEVILPNLCYIGGGGELAYWLELQEYFKSSQIPFPILLLRNSVLLQTSKQLEKLKKLNCATEELFSERHTLINRKVREISNININFDPQRAHLLEQFEGMYEIAEKTDVTFLNAVKAQEVKQLKGLDTLEKRLLKAQRKKLSDHVKRLTMLQNELFPGQSLQERTLNFSEMYLEYGEELIPFLKENLNPLLGEFLILTR